jgi:hypothetical protein
MERMIMTSKKVAELNLEHGSPTVPVAVQNMKNELTTYKGKGYKAIIIIHGYGSTGVGGGIKAAVRRCLGESSMRGIVRLFVGGEDWTNNKRSVLDACRELERHERRIAGNSGVTVVVLR